VNAPTYRVQRRDRPWRDTNPAVLIGPFETPTADELREAIAKLVRAYPKGRLNWRLDESGRRWVADRRPEDMVVEETADPADSTADMLDATWSRYGDRGPLTFVRYPNHLGLALSHAIGDGRSFLEYLGGVAGTAFTGEVPQWLSHPAGRSPLLTAAVRTFGRHPSMVRTAIDDKIEMAVPAPSGTLLPWQPSRRTVLVTFPRALGDEMVAWGKAFKPAPSRFALLACAVSRAVREAGFEITPTMPILVDLRKYLGQGWIDGNFVAGVPMYLGPEVTPQEFSAKVKATLRSGRPLANQMLSSMRAGGWNHFAGQADSFDPQQPLTLTISDLGDSPYLDPIPFSSSESSFFAASGKPDGPHGVTIGITHTPDTTTVSANFHDNVVDAARMQQALDVLAADPLRLVGESKVMR
jgi:hypothetical protein